jgi:hypothetical protein
MQLGKESSTIGSVGLADKRTWGGLHEVARLPLDRLQILTNHDFPTRLWIMWNVHSSPGKSEVARSRRVNLAKLLGWVYRLRPAIPANSAGIVFELRGVCEPKQAPRRRTGYTSRIEIPS